MFACSYSTQQIGRTVFFFSPPPNHKFHHREKVGRRFITACWESSYGTSWVLQEFPTKYLLYGCPQQVEGACWFFLMLWSPLVWCKALTSHLPSPLKSPEQKSSTIITKPAEQSALLLNMGVEQNKSASFCKAFQLTANSTEIFGFEELQQHDFLTLFHTLLTPQRQDFDIYFEKI